MSNDEFVKQKKSKGKKKVQVEPEVQISAGLQSQFAPLEVVEPLEMPPPIQTKPKKISPLIRNAIKSQPEELQFIKVELPKPTLEVENDSVGEEDEDESTDEEVDVVNEQNYEMCPGCYHCNWTGASADGKADCKRNYYGDVN